MITIANAIKEINPNAEFRIIEPTIDDINTAEIEWLNGTTEISKSDIKAKFDEMKTAEANEIQAKEDLKASAKAKLMAGEPMTEEEANLTLHIL